MARTVKPLTDKEIKEAKSKTKDYQLTDGNGLYLLVTSRNTKLWRFNYIFENKRNLTSLGTYPAITLKQARAKKDELRELIATGTNPAQKKKDDKLQAKEVEALKENTFYNISQKWLTSYENEVSENYHIKLSRALKNYLYITYEVDGSKLSIKDKPIDEISRKEIIIILEALKNRGVQETAKRTAMILQKIFRYAVTHEYAPHNIIFDIDLKIVLGKSTKVNYPTITEPSEVKELLEAIETYNGGYSTKMALKLLPFLFVRSANIRQMEWAEIDFQAKEWNIPAHKMKTKEAFVLPLPPQAIEILKEVEANKMSAGYVFCSDIYKDRPMSDNTLVYALKRLGYKDKFVPHSFRAMFSTIANTQLNEVDGHNFSSEVIEACLAHKEPNKVKGAYNRSSYKNAMRGLMEWYANYLDEVKNGVSE
jgi:integrase